MKMREGKKKRRDIEELGKKTKKKDTDDEMRNHCEKDRSRGEVKEGRRKKMDKNKKRQKKRTGSQK